METINPCAPWSLSPNAWIGVKDLVKRCMDGIKPEDVVDELQRQHEEVVFSGGQGMHIQSVALLSRSVTSVQRQ